MTIGMVWSQNSCAYDAIFTILFNIWCCDIENWGTIFTRLGNEFCILLVNEFTRYVQEETSLEAARDTVRRELDKISEYMRFGSYTSIEEICEAIFMTRDAIYRTYYQSALTVTSNSTRNRIQYTFLEGGRHSNQLPNGCKPTHSKEPTDVKYVISQ